MISIKNLNICYDKKVILSDSEIDIPMGSTVLLCGESGSGKTSILEYLTFSQYQNNEEYFIDGIRVDFTDEKIINALKSEKMVYVDQNFQLFDLTVEKNLRMFYQMNPQNKDNKKFTVKLDSLLALVNLDKSLKHKKINVFSGGERQRLALACAIAKNTPIIILDEPMSNLDSESQEVIVNVINTLAQEGKTIIIATHKEDMYDANIIYRIVDKKLVKEVKKEVENKSKLGKCSYDKIHYSNLWRTMHKLNEIVMTLFISLGLALSGLIFMNGNESLKLQITEQEQNISKEILAFTPLHDAYTLFSDYHPAINEQLMKELENINHVASVYPYEVFGSNTLPLKHDGFYGDYTKEDCQIIVSYPDGTNVKKNLNVDGEDPLMSQNYVVAFDAKAQKEQITDNQEINEGLYLTPELAEILEIEDIEGVYLTFKTLVPVASYEVKVEISSEDKPVIDVLGRSPLSVLCEVHLPIAGIKNENYFSEYAMIQGSVFYMDYHEMNDLKAKASFEYKDGIQNYQYNDKNPIIDNQWQPAGCLLFLDELDAMREVGTKVNQIDENLRLISTNPEYNEFYLLLVKTRNKQYFISVTVGIVLVLTVSLFKYVRFSKDIKNHNILKRNGIVINKLNGSKLMVESLTELAISAIIISIFMNRINYNYNQVISELKFMSWSLAGVSLLFMEIAAIMLLNVGLYKVVTSRKKEKSQ